MKNRLSIISSFFVIVPLSFFFSCKKEDGNVQMQLLFKNRMNTPIIVRLYPKPSIKLYDLYYYHEGAAGAVDSEFKIKVGYTKGIFSSKEIDQAPNELLRDYFDSITVNNFDKLMTFSPDTVSGYSVNCYKDKTAWEYSYAENEREAGMHKAITKSHNYTFAFK